MKVYVNLQSKLTTRVFNPEEVKVLPKTVNIYSAVEVISMTAQSSGKPHDGFLVHVYNYKSGQVDPILAYMLSLGNNVTLYIESIKEYVEFQSVRTLKPSEYRHSSKDIVYSYIRNVMNAYAAECYKVDSEMQQLSAKNGKVNKFFVATDEIKQFIRTYAPAYGIQVPRFEEIQDTSDSYLPKKWYDSYEDIVGKLEGNVRVGGVASPDKAFTKWDDKEKLSKQPTSIIEIERIFMSLQFMVRNSVPYDDNYRDCPKCGKPMRTNRYGITELLDSELCPDCNEDLRQFNERCISFNELYMQQAQNECGHKVAAEKNALDA